MKKELRKMNDEKLLNELNDAQQRYNKRFDVWRYTKDKSDSYFMNYYLKTMNNCKKVFEERNIKVEFINGWEIIKEEN